MVTIMLLGFVVAALVALPQTPAPARDSITPARRKRPAIGDTLRPRDFEEVVRRDSTRAGRRPDLVRRAEVTDALRASAFADPGAREVLEKARVARLTNDAAITAYDAKTYQRLSAGLGFKLIGRERLAFRVENSAHVRWSRAVGAHLEITGSRVVMPIIGGFAGGNDTKKDVEKEMSAGMSEMAPIPWYPGKDALWMGGGIARAQVNEREIVHPLASGSEAYYRYATGDSLSINLSKERTIRLRELRITARAPRWNLIVGSFWFDMASGQLVRAVYRLSQAMDPMAVAREVGDSSDKKDMDEIPFWVKPLIFPMQVDLQAITIEYGLFNGVWLPRTQAMEAFARVSFIRLPVRMEERYTYESVNVSDTPLAAITAARRHSTGNSSGAFGGGDNFADEDADSVDTRSVTVGIGSSGATAKVESGRRPSSRSLRDSIQQAVRDTIKARENESPEARAERRRRREVRIAARADTLRMECAANGGFRINTELRYGNTLPVAVRTPCDTTALINSKALPGSIYDSGEELFGAAERDELMQSLDLGLQAGWGPQPIAWNSSIADGMLRYNRVEGFSVGIGARQALGAGLAWHANARYNIGEQAALGELGVERGNGRRMIDLTAYRRTAVANDWGSPFGFGASLAALLYARDEAFYFRTTGAEFTWRTDPTQDVEVRVFGERQDNLPVITRYSVFGGSTSAGFVPNLTAREGTIAGVSTRVRRNHGLDPAGWRLFADGRAEVGAGDWSYQRGAIDLGASHQVVGSLNFALTAGGGAAFGDVPQQRLFYLGGLHTVRGLAPGTPADRGGLVGTPGGTAYWLARSELAYGPASRRVSVYYDAGWTGRKKEWLDPGRPLQGVGVGYSILDGLLRFDVARGVYPTAQWRMDFSVDARF